jgi:hypothetical protein
MNTPDVSPVSTAMRWGALLGVVSIATSVINYFVGGFQPENQDSGFTKLIQYGMWALMILFLVLAMQQHRDKDLGGYMKYGRGLGVGTLVGVFYGLIAAVMAFVIFQYLVPADYVDKVLEMTRDKMLEQNPNMTDEQIDMGLSWTRKAMTQPMLSIFVFIGNVFMCFLFSLLVSAFMKKRNPNSLEI